MPVIFTDDEFEAVAALRKVARNWPASLCLIHHGDSFGLQVKRVDECKDDPAEARSLATVKIRTESVA